MATTFRRPSLDEGRSIELYEWAKKMTFSKNGNMPHGEAGGAGNGRSVQTKKRQKKKKGKRRLSAKFILEKEVRDGDNQRGNKCIAQCNQSMEDHKILSLALFFVAFSLVFLVLPLQWLEASSRNGSSFFGEQINYRGTMFGLLCYCGILQPKLTLSILPFGGKAPKLCLLKIKIVHVHKLCLLLGLVLSSFSPLPPPAEEETVKINLAKRSNFSFGNCTILRDIPSTQNPYGPDSRENKILAMPRRAQYSKVLDYPKATMEIIDNGIEWFLFGSYEIDGLDSSNWDKTCKAEANRWAFTGFFTQCDASCQRPRFICDSACEMFKSVCPDPFVYSAEQGDPLDVNGRKSQYLELLKNIIGAPIIAGNEKLERATKAETDLFLEHAGSLMLEEITFFHSIFKSSTSGTCVPTSEIDKMPFASCYLGNGKTYESKMSNASSNVNCSAAALRLSENEARMDKTRVGGVTATNFFLSKWPGVLLIVSFYLLFLLILLQWARRPVPSKAVQSVWSLPAPLTNGQTKGFRLDLRWRITLVFFAFLSTSFAIAAFLIIYREKGVEEGDITNITYAATTCRIENITYFIIGFASLVGASVAMSSLTFSVVGLGRYKNQKQKKGQICFRMYRCWKEKTDPRGGEYFFLRILLWEISEMVVQLLGIYQFGSSRPQEYVLIALVILALNSTVTPLLLYRGISLSFKFSRTSRQAQFNNGVILFFDTCFDAMFFGLGLAYFQREEFCAFPLSSAINLTWPMIMMIRRVRKLARLIVMRKQKNNKMEGGQRISDHGGSMKSALKWQLRNSTISIDGFNETIRNLRAETPILQYLPVLCILFGFALVNVAQLLYFVAQFVSINAQCSRLLSTPLWEGSSPKITFPNGFLQPPKCSFENISIIQAAHKGVTVVPAAIEQCTSLKVLNLSENKELRALPRELMGLKDVKVADFSGTPVQHWLDASNMSLAGDIPVFIQTHLSASLEYLDVSRNQLSSLLSIKAFSQLKVLKASHNALGPSSIPASIAVSNKRLATIDLRGNPVENRLSWNSIAQAYPLDAVVSFLLRFFNGTLTHLDLSDNSFTRKHFEDLISSMPHLEMFDFSRNLKFEVSASSPLKLHLDKFLMSITTLNLAGNANINGIYSRDLMDMEIKHRTKGTVFNVVGAGINQVKINGNDVSNTNACYPKYIIDQLNKTIVNLDMSNLVFSRTEPFDFESICTLKGLGLLKLTDVSREGQIPFCIPSCWKSLPTLTSLNIDVVKLNETCYKANIGGLKQLTYAFFKQSGWQGKFPVAVPVASGFSAFRLEDTEFEGYIPPSYGNRHHLVVSTKRNTNATINLFQTKSYFTFLSLRCLSSPETTCSLFGNVSNLTIGKRAVIHETNLRGPLFAVKNNFQCLTLPLSRTHDKLGVLDVEWGMNCSNVSNVRNYKDYKTRGSFVVTEETARIGMIAKCIVRNNKNVSLLCYEVLGTEKWECHTELFLKAHNPCELIN